MEKLLESALTNESKTSKSDFLKIFYSCLEDESFLDEFRAYMKQYMFHSLKQSKLKFLTEPTQVIKCHSISPKIQSMNLLIADYLLRQDFLYTLSVFSSEAPNLKNLTSFSNYINSLAGTDASVQQHNHAPKLMSRDVKDILECLGLSPQCDESVEARQQYMHCDEDEPLLLCLLSTLVSTMQNIDRCPRCKVSHEELKSLTMYQDCDISQQSPHLPEFSPWQNELCQLLHQYCLGPSEVIELVKKMTVIINKELETAENKNESHLTEKEEHLRKYEEMFSENLEEAERHLLVQKQSLEKELVRKQRELQEVARVLSKKKANISEAVNILQKQKDLLTEKEKEFNSMMTTLNDQLEIRARKLDARENKMKEGFDKLSRQKETFYEQLLKVCSSKMDPRKEDSRNAIVRSPPSEHVNKIIETKITNNIKAIEGRDSQGNGQRSNETRHQHKEEISSKINEIHNLGNKNKPNDFNDRRVDSIEENISINNHVTRRNPYDNNDKAKDTVEDSINRINSQDLIALLKTIQVQSEAMKGFLQERHRDVSKQNSNSAKHEEKYMRVADGSQCTSGVTSTQGKHSTPGKCVRVIRTDSPLSSLGDSCRVNDENTICDRCGSEVILKFHIDEKGQKSASCTKSASSRMNNHLSPIEDRSLERTLEDKRHTGRYENHSVRSDRCDSELLIDRGRQETNRLQSQMAELMTRFEKMSANQNGQTERERELSNNKLFNNEQRYGQKCQNTMHPEPLNEKTDLSRHTLDTLKYQPDTAPLQGEGIDDPVDLSRQTLARLSSQISALDESFDKYRAKIRKENELCNSEGDDMQRLEKLLTKSSRYEKRGITKHQQSTRGFLHQAGAQPLQPQPSVIHQSTIDPPTQLPTLRFTNTRTGSLFPSGKHQQVPPYFSNNPSFWQSYLKTYHVPVNKNKSWQEHFQDFAGQVEEKNAGMVRHRQKNMREENGMSSDGSDSRSTNDESNDKNKTRRLTKPSRSTNDESRDNNKTRRLTKPDQRYKSDVHTVQKSGKSNQNRNRFLNQPDPKTKDETNQNEHEQINDTLDQRTNSYYNRLNTESDRHVPNDQLKRLNTVEPDINQMKERLTKESKENSKQNEQREQTNEEIEKLPIISEVYKPQSHFYSARDSNVDREDNLTKEFTLEESEIFRDADEKDENIVEPPKDRGDDKKNANIVEPPKDTGDDNKDVNIVEPPKDTGDDKKDVDMDGTKDNSVVEYDTRGSLLFHMQDSDENRKNPSQTKTTQLTVENQKGIRLPSNSYRIDDMRITAVENQDINTDNPLETSIGEMKSRYSVFSMESKQKKTSNEISITDHLSLKSIDIENSLNPLPPQKVSELSDIAERSFDLTKSPPEALKSPNYSLSRNKSNLVMSQGVLMSDEDSNSELSVHTPGQRSLDEW